MKFKQCILVSLAASALIPQMSVALASPAGGSSDDISGFSVLSRQVRETDPYSSAPEADTGDASEAKSGDASGAKSGDVPDADDSDTAAIGISEEDIRRMLNPFDDYFAGLPASEEQTEADEETEEETETEPEALPDGTEAETEEESGAENGKSPLSSASPVIGEDESENETPETFPSGSAGSLFLAPKIKDYNPARPNLYDYRMLRDFPLSTLPKDLHSLYYTLQDMTEDYDGTWSVYVEDLSTRQALIVGDQPMKSASTMKLFIMAAVYDQIDKGRIERTDEIVSLLHDMISNSSNEAANRLLLKLGDGEYDDGVAAVDRYISSHGYSSDTHEYNGFEDSSAIVDGSHFNQISARDIGLLLERIYSRNFISRKVCNEIENMMLSQATRYKIPKGLPDGVEVANKTGEMDTVENDCAVVYGSNTDFILVVLSMDWNDKNTAQTEIQKIAGTVYEYLN